MKIDGVKDFTYVEIALATNNLKALLRLAKEGMGWFIKAF